MSEQTLTVPLRTCRMCGLTANTIEGLALFRDMKKSKYHKDNLCKQCFLKELRKGGKYGYIRTNYYYQNLKPRRMGFKNNLKGRCDCVTLQKPIRTNVCSKCGKKYPETMDRQTCLHHEEYDPNNPIAHTVELCSSCHMKLHSERGDVTRLNGKEMILPHGQGKKELRVAHDRN